MKEPRLATRRAAAKRASGPGTSPEPAPTRAVLKDISSREHELEVVDGSASKQLLQFLDGHADVGADAAQRSLRHVPAFVYRHCCAPPVRMAHDVVAARHPSDLEPGSF